MPIVVRMLSGHSRIDAPYDHGVDDDGDEVDDGADEVGADGADEDDNEVDDGADEDDNDDDNHDFSLTSLNPEPSRRGLDRPVHVLRLGNHHHLHHHHYHDYNHYHYHPHYHFHHLASVFRLVLLLNSAEKQASILLHLVGIPICICICI